MAADFFSVFSPELTSSLKLDEDLSASEKDQLVCIFLWGHDCPNCEIAKKVLVEYKTEVQTLRLKWFHANIYQDFDLATRFGLHGIPVFLFFKNNKKLGKISPFPSFASFYEAVSKLSLRDY